MRNYLTGVDLRRGFSLVVPAAGLRLLNCEVESGFASVLRADERSFAGPFPVFCAFLPFPRVAARASIRAAASSLVIVSGVLAAGRVAFTPSWLTSGPLRPFLATTVLPFS